MVNRPPPKAGPSGKNEESDAIASSTQRASSIRGPRHGLEWSLRSMHKIDTSAQHFLSSYYGEDADSDDGSDGNYQEDQTAFEIFKTKDEKDAEGKRKDTVWASLNAPLRTGVVDGKKVVFELHTDVTQKPATNRNDRLKRRHVTVNSDRSSWEVRLRFWLMRFKVMTLATAFLAVFVVMNLLFATYFYLSEGRCCGDSTMSFSDVFAFTIQSSTTIGYGALSPVGTASNLLVVLLSYTSTLLNTLFAGLLFTKFVTPVINIQFSDVMTLCNVNGVPCLSFRMGNADGYENPLTDINVRLTYSYEIPYTSHNGKQKFFRQSEELRLLSNRQHGLLEVWTLRHVLDETSPLFGLHFEEHPANKIFVFTISIDAVQDLTKSSVNVQTQYAVEDILIGHTFKSQVTIDAEARVATSDYSKMSDTELYPVWYPALTGAYNSNVQHTEAKIFKP